MNSSTDIHNYDNIIELQHHLSKTHPHMSMHDRAAQFSPFSALTGYEESIAESERITDKKINLDENIKSLLDYKINILLSHLSEHPEVSITYFIPDNKKSGGRYSKVSGKIIKFDRLSYTLSLDNKNIIAIKDIIDMESPLFTDYKGI